MIDAVTLAVEVGVAVFEDDQEGDTDGFDPYPACSTHVTKPDCDAATPMKYVPLIPRK